MRSVGLIGCGAVVHSLYAKTLRGRSAYAVRYVSDPRQEQAVSAARLFGAEIAPIEELIERSDAIVIAAPPDTHARLLRTSIRPGKLILCEKPFTTSLRDAVELTKEAESCGARLYVGHFRRTFPQLELARSLIALGVLGVVTDIWISEGGRFTWKAVSEYTIRSEYGGVWWDTGPHSMDMALFASGLDAWTECSVGDLSVEKDKPEPSHDLSARFTLADGSRVGRISCFVHVSRKDVLPNFIRISGDRGSLAFSVMADRYVRLTTDRGSTVLTGDPEHVDLTRYFDLQIQRILLAQGDGDFSAERFLALTAILEAVAHG